MPIDLQNVAAVWAPVGFAYSAWKTTLLMRGGENSPFAKQVRADPTLETLPNAALLTGILLPNLILGQLWPVLLPWGGVMALRRWRAKSRVIMLHRSPKLAALRKRLIGHEQDYRDALIEHDFDMAIPALTSIDTSAIRTGADIESIRADIIELALKYSHFQYFLSLQTKSGRRKAATLLNELRASEKYYAAAPSRAFGNLLTGYAHGWLPDDLYNDTKTWYAQNLDPAVASADRLYALFSPITCRAPNEIARVQVVSDLPADLDAFDRELLVVPDDRPAAPHTAGPAAVTEQQPADRSDGVAASPTSKGQR